MTPKLYKSTIEDDLFFDKTESIKKLVCLRGDDVITAQISDHHPIVHDGVLFWNIMMQAKSWVRNEEHGFNNGFGIVETEAQYLDRLTKVGQVAAEIVSRCPSIGAIAFCEGPVHEVAINALTNSLKKSDVMDRFFESTSESGSFYKPKSAEAGAMNWGLLMLADSRYRVESLDCEFISDPVMAKRLANRFQIWRLTEEASDKYLALGHLPFAGDEQVADKLKLSDFGRQYCDLVTKLLSHHAEDEFVLCADFNLNPHLVGAWEDRALDEISRHNSILLTRAEPQKTSRVTPVTVDGVLLSRREKQKYGGFHVSAGLFARLKTERALLQSALRVARDHELSSAFEPRFALVPYGK